MPGMNMRKKAQPATTVVFRAFTQVPANQSRMVTTMIMMAFFSLPSMGPSFSFSAKTACCASTGMASGLKMRIRERLTSRHMMRAKGRHMTNHCRKETSTPWACSRLWAIRLPGLPAGEMKPPLPQAKGRPIMRHLPSRDSPGFRPADFRNMKMMP